MFEGDIGAIETTEGKTYLQVPEKITAEWIEEAQKIGYIEYGGRKFFLRSDPDSQREVAWRLENYGLPTSGSDGEGYIYHGTHVEDLPSIVHDGVLGKPEHPTLSTVWSEEVVNAAQNRHSDLKKGIVCVWKSPWKNVEIPPYSWPEQMGWPAKRFEDDRSRLNIPDHLKETQDLRQLKPDDGLIGFYVVKQEMVQPETPALGVIP